MSTPTSAVPAGRNRYRVGVVLGRAKIGRRQRTDDVDTQQQDQPDSELESYLAALSPEEDPETTGTGRSFGTSEVHQLRLPLMANERLKELAAEQGTSPSALARDWVLQHLNDHPAPEEAEWPGSAEPRPAHAHPEAGGNEQWPADEGFPTEFPEATAPGSGYSPADFPDHGVEETDTEITIPHGQYRY